MLAEDHLTVSSKLAAPVRLAVEPATELALRAVPEVAVELVECSLTFESDDRRLRGPRAAQCVQQVAASSPAGGACVRPEAFWKIWAKLVRNEKASSSSRSSGRSRALPPPGRLPLAGGCLAAAGSGLAGRSSRVASATSADRPSRTDLGESAS